MSPHRFAFFSAVIAAALCLPALGADGPPARKMEPKDEAHRDPSLVAFIANMNTIVKERNATKLMALMGPVFKVEFHVGKGPVAFKAYWHPENPKSEIWPLLERLLAIGGTFYTPTLFTIPYVYSRFPQDLDPWSSVVVVKEDVALRAEPKADAAVVQKLSNNVVRVDEEFKPPVRLDKVEWLHVTTPDGAGYISTADIYSPVAHRIFFEKQQGQWRWLSLVAAD